jgi:flagellar motor switch/type III secretory pathway protein FliN
MTNAERLVRLDDVPVEIEAAIAGPVLRVREILALRVGRVIAAPSRAGDSVDLFAGGARIGDGELSRSGDRPVIRMVRFGSER